MQIISLSLPLSFPCARVCTIKCMEYITYYIYKQDSLKPAYRPLRLNVLVFIFAFSPRSIERINHSIISECKIFDKPISQLYDDDRVVSEWRQKPWIKLSFAIYATFFWTSVCRVLHAAMAFDLILFGVFFFVLYRSCFGFQTNIYVYKSISILLFFVMGGKRV